MERITIMQAKLIAFLCKQLDHRKNLLKIEKWENENLLFIAISKKRRIMFDRRIFNVGVSAMTNHDSTKKKKKFSSASFFFSLPLHETKDKERILSFLFVLHLSFVSQCKQLVNNVNVVTGGKW